jgi:serine/threonine protein kinase
VLERLLGYGGSSAVFLARSLTLEEQVAVKVFLPRSTLDGQMRKSFYQRFLREAEAASQLDHPHILSVYAYGEHDGLPYIVMPYMIGGTLSEHLQHYGPLSLEDALNYLEQMAAALDYAHEHNCVHCDVKPANILLDADGNAALSDFGIVHLLQPEEEAGSSDKAAKKSKGETLMGTPDYVSPEQALGEKLDGRSDVYSLGATLYALLTGDPPFRADTPIALALMHVHEAPTPVGLFRADITPQLDFVMSKALAKWPEERFQTAGIFAEAFKLALQETGEYMSPLARPRAQKNQSSDGHASSNAPGSFASSSVQIKALPRRHFRLLRASLVLSLVVALVLASLVTALLIRNLTTNHSRSNGGPLVASASGPPDLLVQDKGNWPTSNTFFFQGNTYAIENTSTLGDPEMAFYGNHLYRNFTIQVTTTELSGTSDEADYYGLVFRAASDQSHFYLFNVSAAENGQYTFMRYDGGSQWMPLSSGHISGFHSNKHDSNTLRVEARGNSFALFINGTLAGKTFEDSSKKALISGEVGLMVEERGSKVAFSHLYITTLSAS